MDGTDLRLLALLKLNSRIPYRDLAKTVGLSVQAVHRRIQALVDCGVIRRFTTHLSEAYLDAIRINISGFSKASSYDDIIENVRKEGTTEIFGISTGNRIIIQALMKDTHAIEPYLDFLKRTVIMDELTPLGLQSILQHGTRASGKGRPSKLELKSLDYKIAAKLWEDSRTPVVTIAQDLKVSTKTVVRRLDRMIAENTLEFSIDWDLGAVPGSSGLMFIYLKPEKNKEQFRREITEEFGNSIFTIITYGNLPNIIFLDVWAPTNMALGKIVEEIKKKEAIQLAKSDVIYKMCHFDTWRDRLLLERSSGP